MGMYDEIKCDYPLPDAHMQNRTFQTKSFDCLLDRYTISDEGRLIHNTHTLELTPEDKLPYPDTPFIGMYTRVETGPVDTEYHGDVFFYDWDDRSNSDLIEYQARFTDGQLQWIKRVDSN